MNRKDLADKQWNPVQDYRPPDDCQLHGLDWILKTRFERYQQLAVLLVAVFFFWSAAFISGVSHKTFHISFSNAKTKKHATRSRRRDRNDDITAFEKKHDIALLVKSGYPKSAPVKTDGDFLFTEKFILADSTLVHFFGIRCISPKPASDIIASPPSRAPPRLLSACC